MLKTKKMTKKDYRDLTAKYKKERLIHGGSYSNIRIGRSRGRPLAHRYIMHFTLRSTQARGAWSFFCHDHKIRSIIKKFAFKNGVEIVKFANVGNHLHLVLQLSRTHERKSFARTYRAFIRAITSAIMMAVTGVSRWSKVKLAKKFWDLRPFSRIVVGAKAVATILDYVQINIFQGAGYTRDQAEFMVKFDWNTWEFR